MRVGEGMHASGERGELLRYGTRGSAWIGNRVFRVSERCACNAMHFWAGPGAAAAAAAAALLSDRGRDPGVRIGKHPLLSDLP